MLITPEKIENWRQNPKQFDYDSGRHKAAIDAWNDPEPMVFTKENSKSFREGYRVSWAKQKAILNHDTLYDDICDNLVREEYQKVLSRTNEIAECSDDDAPEYCEIDWERVIYLLNHSDE